MVLHHASLPSCAHLKGIAKAGRFRGAVYPVGRLFDTYADPEQVDLTRPYGIQETVHPVRMVVGLQAAKQIINQPQLVTICKNL